MVKLWLDFESFSETPIKHGTHAYAANAEILICTYAFDDGPVQVFDATLHGQIPPELDAAFVDHSVEIWAHSSSFDRTILRMCWGIEVPISNWRDTMVQALSHSLPASLGTLCEVLGLPADKAKDKAGKKLIQLFCKPRLNFTHRLTVDSFPGETLRDKRLALMDWAAKAKAAQIRRATKETHPEEWAQFIEYAKSDIEAMREVHKRMPMWNYQGAELDLWHLDQKINDRGMCMDVELARAAVAAVELAQVGLASKTLEITEGEVESTTKRDALLQHIVEMYGVVMPNLQKATVVSFLENEDLDPNLRELLEMRQQASTSSTAKYKTLLVSVSADGRLRNTKQFNGAGRTGRWAGRLFQPDNLPRPTLPQDIINVGIEALKAGCADLVTDNVMQLTSSALRSAIIAPKGKKLVVSDLANIEGRTQAWLAGEDWKLQAFRDYDAGTGPDLYKLSYSKSFSVPVDSVTKENRQIGKTQELALAYQGGVGAIATFATAFNIDIEALALKVLPVAPGDLMDQASKFYDWVVKKGMSTHNMSRDAFVACEVIKRGWRLAHPEMVTFWTELQNCTVQAIKQSGKTIECRRLKIRRDGNWLRLGLPSGRALCYPKPEVNDENEISFMGIDQFTRKWSRQRTYAGKLFENCNQALARDVLTANMPAIDAAKYEIILSLHDELIAEAPDTWDFNHGTLSHMMATQPAWALDMPLSAAGFETKAYRKD